MLKIMTNQIHLLRHQASSSSTGKEASTGNGNEQNQRKTHPATQRPRDAFQFYSNPENLRRAMNLEPIDFSTEDQDNTQVEKRSRISFEKEPLAMLLDRMENDEETRPPSTPRESLRLLVVHIFHE